MQRGLRVGEYLEQLLGRDGEVDAVGKQILEIANFESLLSTLIVP
jgi:hypothetical protein